MKSQSATRAAACCALLGAFGVSAANAALMVTAQTGADVLVGSLITGSGFTTSGASLTGNVQSSAEQQGTFSGGSSTVGLEVGVILTSGTAANALGPNTLEDATGQAGGSGNAALSALVGNASTDDANVLTFNFLPTVAGTLLFRYVFASEEYNALGNQTNPTPFDDVFGLFVDGTNRALVGGANRVSINTVNCGSADRGTLTQNLPGGPNCDLFINNNFDNGAAPYEIQYDGFTQVRTASINVAAGNQYAVQLAIADTFDDRVDSAVLIAGEFRAEGNGNGNGAPEPGSMALAAIAMLSMAAARRRYAAAKR